MTENEKLDLIKWNLIKIIEHEMNLKKREEAKYAKSRKISS